MKILLAFLWGAATSTGYFLYHITKDSGWLIPLIIGLLGIIIYIVIEAIEE